ncbi:MAG: Nif3-like dinuclear metal center hexameric protein, partial [Planctomycetota bacterium]
MNTSDLHQHLLSRAPWVNPDSTVDTVKAGDPARAIETVGVGWYASVYDLQAAVELGCDLFITHE